jgi:hypothetical protein
MRARRVLLSGGMNKSIKGGKKLALNKSTMRNLSAADLEMVGGGVDSAAAPPVNDPIVGGGGLNFKTFTCQNSAIYTRCLGYCPKMNVAL